ncbi:MAG: TonB-dependent receptor domain-containing protein, partial [Blastocatellia bacterium]
LKGGVDVIIEKIENFFPGNFGGRYFFQATNGYAEYANHLDATNAGFRRVTRFQQSFAGDGTTGALTQPNFSEYGFFVQDDWRAHKNLTINLGLRYDIQALKRPPTANPSATLAAAGLSTTQLKNDHDNIAPRIGLAWNPKAGLVVRAAYGLFYGRTPAIALGTSHSNNGINVIGVTLSNVQLPFVYPNRFANLDAIRALGGTLAVPDIFIFDKNYQQPYTQQGNLGFEYSLTRDVAVGATYLRVKGTNLSRTRDLNLLAPVATTIPLTGGPTLTFLRHPGATAPARPIAGFGRISQFEGSADSSYNALALTMKKRFSKSFSVDASYTWSKILDNTPDQTSVVVGGGDDAKQAQQTFGLPDDRGLGGSDVPHRFVLNGVWSLDYAKGMKGAPRFFLHGWEVAGILQVSSNIPLNEVLGADLNNDGNNRTDRSPTIGRNTIRGDRIETFDLRVTKGFGFKEDKVRVQLIGELFNAFNHLNYGSTLGGAYLQNTRYRVNGINTATANLTLRTDFLDPRSVPNDGQRIGQLALKIIF